MNNLPQTMLWGEAAQRASNSCPEVNDQDTEISLVSWLVLVVFLCAFLMFAGTLGHDLVWDDERFIQYAEDVVTEGGVLALVTSEFRPNASDGPNTAYFRPISLASLWLDKHLGADSTVVFHLTNALLDALCSALVLVPFGMVLGSRSGALGGALLFAVHPVHVESVAFVSGRTDLLASVFCLLIGDLWGRLYKGRHLKAAVVIPGGCTTLDFFRGDLLLQQGLAERGDPVFGDGDRGAGSCHWLL